MTGYRHSVPMYRSAVLFHRFVFAVCTLHCVTSLLSLLVQAADSVVHHLVSINAISEREKTVSPEMTSDASGSVSSKPSFSRITSSGVEKLDKLNLEKIFRCNWRHATRAAKSEGCLVAGTTPTTSRTTRPSSRYLSFGIEGLPIAAPSLLHFWGLNIDKCLLPSYKHLVLACPSDSKHIKEYPASFDEKLFIEYDFFVKKDDPLYMLKVQRPIDKNESFYRDMVQIFGRWIFQKDGVRHRRNRSLSFYP